MVRSWDLGELRGEHPPTSREKASLTQSLDPDEQSPQNKSQNCLLFTKPYPLEGVRCHMNQYMPGVPEDSSLYTRLEVFIDPHLQRQPPVSLYTGMKTKAWSS